MHFDEAMETLKGVTLESVVIAGQTAEAVKALIAAGKESKENFPLLLHIDELINGGKRVDIPWKKFETETIV